MISWLVVRAVFGHEGAYRAIRSHTGASLAVFGEVVVCQGVVAWRETSYGAWMVVVAVMRARPRMVMYSFWHVSVVLSFCIITKTGTVRLRTQDARLPALLG